MNLVQILTYIFNHPLNKRRKRKSFLKFIKWQIGGKINRFPIIYDFSENTRMIIKKGLTGATGNFYCGLHDFSEMSFLLHFLRRDDLFIDIGANIGSYSLLASGEIGCQSICFEPSVSTYGNLIDNININKLQSKVRTLNMAIGSEKTELSFTKSLDTMNHITNENGDNSIKVKVDTLDDILNKGKIPILIKVDVEGYETEVLKGANSTLLNNQLKAIIIELNGSGKRYGFDENEIHNKLLELNFLPYSYDPWKRNLHLVDSYGKDNTIYIRDINFVKERLHHAKKYKMFHYEI